jgi:hypothetical protein
LRRMATIPDKHLLARDPHQAAATHLYSMPC